MALIPRSTRSLAFLLAALLIGLPLQAVTWSKHVSAPFRHVSEYHADLNHDGREDIVFSFSPGFYVQLANGGGTYAVPVGYETQDSSPASAIAIGNFISSSGDLAVVTGSTAVWIYQNNGKGQFSLAVTIAAPDNVDEIVAGDFNHDGNMDIAYGMRNTHQIQVLFGPFTNGAFTVGPVTTVPEINNLRVGDFDGDGKADLVASAGSTTANAHVYYGDGTGSFPAQVAVGDGSTITFLRPLDVNGDGRTDLVGAAYTEDSVGNTTGFPFVDIFYGDASRTFTETHLATSRCLPTDRSNTVMVADFNGDGIPDLVYEGASTCGDSAAHALILRTGKGGGAFNAEQTIYTSSLTVFDPEAIRASLSNAPALDFMQCTDANCQGFEAQSWLNTTSGAFPTCTPPIGFIGINVCGPGSGATVSSPVHFRVGAVTQTQARKVEVWVDGKKAGEQLTHAFSHYAFMDKSFSLTSGKHSITVFAAGWDNWVEKKSFSITVP